MVSNGWTKVQLRRLRTFDRLGRLKIEHYGGDDRGAVLYAAPTPPSLVRLGLQDLRSHTHSSNHLDLAPWSPLRLCYATACNNRPSAVAKLKNPERLGTKPVKDTPSKDTSKDTAIREAFGFSKPQKTGSRMSRKGPFLLV